MLKKENLPEESVVVEHVQPRKCCAHEHEWCQKAPDYIKYEDDLKKSKKYWEDKMKELKELSL